jgi:hypothetical protein
VLGKLSLNSISFFNKPVLSLLKGPAWTENVNTINVPPHALCALLRLAEALSKGNGFV